MRPSPRDRDWLGAAGDVLAVAFWGWFTVCLFAVAPLLDIIVFNLKGG